MAITGWFLKRKRRPWVNLPTWLRTDKWVTCPASSRSPSCARRSALRAWPRTPSSTTTSSTTSSSSKAALRRPNCLWRSSICRTSGVAGSATATRKSLKSSKRLTTMAVRPPQTASTTTMRLACGGHLGAWMIRRATTLTIGQMTTTMTLAAKWCRFPDSDRTKQ